MGPAADLRAVGSGTAGVGAAAPPPFWCNGRAGAGRGIQGAVGVGGGTLGTGRKGPGYPGYQASGSATAMDGSVECQ